MTMRLELVRETDSERAWGFVSGDVHVELVSVNGSDRVECYARPNGVTGSFMHRGTRYLNGESSRSVAVTWAREITGMHYV